MAIPLFYGEDATYPKLDHLGATQRLEELRQQENYWLYGQRIDAWLTTHLTSSRSSKKSGKGR